MSNQTRIYCFVFNYSILILNCVPWDHDLLSSFWQFKRSKLCRTEFRCCIVLSYVRGVRGREFRILSWHASHLLCLHSVCYNQRLRWCLIKCVQYTISVLIKNSCSKGHQLICFVVVINAQMQVIFCLHSVYNQSWFILFMFIGHVLPHSISWPGLFVTRRAFQKFRIFRLHSVYNQRQSLRFRWCWSAFNCDDTHRLCTKLAKLDELNEYHQDYNNRSKRN